jgi:hypothetical protein
MSTGPWDPPTAGQIHKRRRRRRVLPGNLRRDSGPSSLTGLKAELHIELWNSGTVGINSHVVRAVVSRSNYGYAHFPDRRQGKPTPGEVGRPSPLPSYLLRADKILFTLPSIHLKPYQAPRNCELFSVKPVPAPNQTSEHDGGIAARCRGSRGITNPPLALELSGGIRWVPLGPPKRKMEGT